MAEKKRRRKKKPAPKRRKKRTLSPWKTIGLYGGSGIGKTTLAAGGPAPMFLDSNFGMMSIDGKPGYEDVERTPIHGMKQLDRAYDNLTGTGRKDWTGRRTVVFDHFYDIQGQVLDELTVAGAERDPRRIMDEVQQREWGIMGNRLRRHLRKMKALPMHKVLIFAVGEDRETGKKQPFLQGSLKSQLPYFCDIIMFMRMDKKGRRIVYLDDNPRFLAKCRAWWMPSFRWRFREEDTQFLTHLLALINAGGKGIDAVLKEKEQWVKEAIISR